MSVVPSLDGFVFAEKLGKGSYATVYKAYQIKDKRDVVAIKCVSKSSLTKSSVENLITEISILKKVKHENVVELIDFQWDNTYIYLILEYCSGGDLSRFIRSKRRLPEYLAQRFLQHLAKALHFLRSQNIAHMDLKPQNILLTAGKYPVLKLADFGLAQYLHPESEASSLRGSPLYMAPEILLKHHYDARVDLWSVGIILYECLFGQAPFSSHSFAELAEKIKSSNPIQIPYGAEVSDSCRNLILGLLQRDPNKRMTFEEFFNHPVVDLEHAPSELSFQKGAHVVLKALQLDKEGNVRDAFDGYRVALEYFLPHLFYESNAIRRAELREKVECYMKRAEQLKNIYKERRKELKRKLLLKKTPSDPVVKEMPTDVVVKEMPTDVVVKEMPTDVVVKEMPTDVVVKEMPNDLNVKEIPNSLVVKKMPNDLVAEKFPNDLVVKETPKLEEILAARPDLRKALYLAKQGDALVSEGAFEDANEIYKSALEIMVPAVSEEPSGPAKEVIYQEVNKWMQKAEDLKLYMSILVEEKRMKQMKSTTEIMHYNAASESVESTCCIQ